MSCSGSGDRKTFISFRAGGRPPAPASRYDARRIESDHQAEFSPIGQEARRCRCGYRSRGVGDRTCCRARLSAWGGALAAFLPGRRAAVSLWLALATFALLDGSAPSASFERVARHVQSSSAAGLRGRVAASYDLYASYPNARRMRGYFLRGVNEYGSATSSSGPQRTSLWFQAQVGGSFRQFNTTPYRECHWDLLRWGSGERGLLVYLATRADCYSDHTTIVFRPGIAYMPKTWAPGER